jgi:hypothetical protein
VVLRVEPDRAVREDDERPDMEPRSYPDRSPDDEGHGRAGRLLYEGVQTCITPREGQAISESYLVSRQRQLRKDGDLCLYFRRDANESNVLLDVCPDIATHGDSLSDGYRTSARHAVTVMLACAIREGRPERHPAPLVDLLAYGLQLGADALDGVGP